MNCWLSFAAIALLVAAAPAKAAGISGQYVEARTCDVWTAPCFANAEMNLTGKHAVMAWKVEKGTLDDVRLDGLGVVAVVAASDTLGLKQTGSSRAVVIVDSKADSAQRAALVRFVKREAGALAGNVIAVHSAPIDLNLCKCKEGGCASFQAGAAARIETRCIDREHDKKCGNESCFYPPLARDVTVRPAVAVQHSFKGQGINATWNETDRRGAYVGSFETR